MMASEYILNCHDIESIITSFMLPHEIGNLALVDKQHYTKYRKYYKFFQYRRSREKNIDIFNNNDIMYACEFNDNDILIKYLNYHRVDKSISTMQIINLANQACVNNNVFMIGYLTKIRLHIIIDQKNHIYQYACMYGAFGIFDYIMQFKPDIHAHNDRGFRRACYNKCPKIYNKLIELGCSFDIIPIYKLDKCDDFVINKVIILEHTEDDIIRAFYKFVVIKSTELVNLLLKHFEIPDIVLRECIQMAIGCDDKEMIKLLQ